MKAENGCREELRQGYCSFPPYPLSKGVSDLTRGEMSGGAKHYFCAGKKWKYVSNYLKRKSIV